MIKIVSFKICPFVQRVTAMLEAKTISYEIEYIELKNKPQWFLDISTTGQVPMLITEHGTPLFESDAIVEYIDEVTPPLQDNLSPEQRAINRAWSYQASKHYLVQCSTMQSADKGILDERMAKLIKSFEKAEKQLGEGPYFFGQKLGNVDMAWLPLLHRAAIVEDHSGYDMLSDYPKVKAWQKTLLETGIPEKSVPTDFDEKFSTFYLDDRTWLGRGANLNEAATSTSQPQTGGCCG
ncbi:MAG: glutathione S-transferase family protein [Roseibium sp.]|uniref:glutathione S-transferase family protein n=1 Tax=Roseibium sp. TaxID=1936156 RepID=UPI002623F291|nr:glutathione S-transferase family protein [Roseibium sp.]MCV0425945.1 glutathione S-transferase family protein [Roseibium sp.]